MKKLIILVVLLSSCKSTATHKCDAYESRPTTKKK